MGSIYIVIMKKIKIEKSKIVNSIISSKCNMKYVDVLFDNRYNYSVEYPLYTPYFQSWDSVCYLSRNYMKCVKLGYNVYLRVVYEKDPF